MPHLDDKVLVCLSDLEPESVDWLWPGVIAAGKPTLIDGDPGEGKSLLTLDIAARLTTGRPFPDGSPAPGPCAVVLLGREDGLRDTVVPRLLAAGADRSRIHALRGRRLPGGSCRPPTFPADCDLLRDSLRQTGARLVITDPLDAFLDPRLGGLNSPLVRHALAAVTDVIEEARAGLNMVRHLNKAVRSVSALYRGLGSIAIGAAARTGLLVGRHPDDPELRVLACSKPSLTACPPSLAFRIVEGPGGRPVLDWAGPVDLTADDLVLCPARGAGPALSRAVAFLEEALAGGPCPHAEVLRRARRLGLTPRTLDRAKALLGVVSEQTSSAGRNHWSWSLPASAADEAFTPDEPFTAETARRLEEVWRTEEPPPPAEPDQHTTDHTDDTDQDPPPET
jgi:AAA domain